MAELVFKTKGNASPKDKPKVYFTCHPDDFDRYFEQICEDIFKTYDCAIFYTEDMTAQLDDENRDLDLYSMNLFVMPITFRLLTEPNRAMDEDYAFADEKHIPVLPMMMETSIDDFYSRRFGERQYIYIYESDPSKRSYPEQLENYLNTVFLNKETVERIRKAFDAYIFLSYRKKDRRYANELMKMIHSHPELEKLAIWYDEFLTPGESFMENIQKILSDSQLFTLLVTPNLLEKPNFVMEHEYPAAHDSGKPILPAQMVSTDSEQLKADYTDIPDAIDVQDEAVFDTQFLEVLRRYAVTESRDNPEHNYLIGLAYLDGIDVEVDKERGVQMITAAAKADLPEAMKKLWDIYTKGIHVSLDYHEALKWAKRLYEHHKNSFGEKDPETLTAQNDLALAYGNIGDYQKLLELNESCYALRCEILGEKHSDTLTSLSNLGASYREVGEYKKALEIIERCYSLFIEIYGEKNSKAIITLGNLATIYYESGNIMESISTIERCTNMMLDYYGEDNCEASLGLSSFSIIYGEIGYYNKQIELSKKCYRILLKNKGKNHPHTLFALHNLSEAAGNSGNFKKELELSRECYQTSIIVFGERHPFSIISLHGYARAIGANQKAQKAFESIKKCYNMSCETLGKEHPKTLLILRDYAIAYGELRQYEQYNELMKECYELQCKVLGEQHPDTIKTYSNLALSYASLGRHHKALIYANKSYKAIKQLKGEFNPDCYFCLDALLAIHLNLHNKSEVKKICEYVYLHNQIIDPLLLLHTFLLIKDSGKNRKRAQEIKQRLDILRSELDDIFIGES